MQNVIQAKSSEALVAGYERAKYNAMVSGLKLAQTGQPMYQAHHAGDLEMVAAYEAEIAARIAARIEENKAIELNAEAIEAAYWERMDAIADAADYKIAQLEKEYEESEDQLSGEEF